MKNYHGIQGLRYLAAILVVGMHTSEAMHQRLLDIEIPKLNFGSIGVDMFFIISGFIMMASTDGVHASITKPKLALQFITKRIIRIIPMYWLYTTLKVVSVLIIPTLALRTKLDPTHVTCSYLLFPCEAPWGLIQPVLPVGWTLSFELLFYFIFALTIALGINRMLGTMLVFIFIYTAGALWQGNTVFSFFGKSIIFEFILGMLIYLLTKRVKVAWHGVFLFLIGITSLIYGVQNILHLDRLIAVGIPCAFIVAGVIALENWITQTRINKILTPLGDSSYSLYLSHSFTVPLMVVIFSQININQAWLVIASTILTSTFIGLISFHLIEKPIQTKLTLLHRQSITENNKTSESQ